MNWDMVSSIAQVFGFGGIVWGLYANRRTLQTQVAMEFYRRFSDLSSRMPNELRLAHDVPALNTLPDAKKTAITLAAIDYFNLCSEEFALHAKGRLPRDAWQVTAAEIDRRLVSPLWARCVARRERRIRNPWGVRFIPDKAMRSVRVH